ncbi:hypothetical protein Kpol_1002p30 [Vanderwaltozyma polyspora DSM 70294]|uniref:MoaB/Mog domain-containing protein n=1 Tax=Vanderwaltozyma polyspora (strain ATCC 22028 / DSM 70294 / BCRC 21397 / CBS 2163 / NBRC 10782 / NRRL Y-8283 / UCD 57-17) TaxID=436907 RepID=A7TE62_VANPO|nr:uncharacterized protein Kpol_1002p30 [Vanderwaltozyma polyspora DSM 70294]EDO19384.1 hypothetical protein Kpol_1002p30 [Vanderwaltozyma polyspora DSM 70294]
MPKTTAACLIIGDEVLNGKIQDANSPFFAKYCYNLGIELKEIVTVGDEEEQIINSIKRLSKKYDFIATTGGIGPTHDDITYECIAKAFGLDCILDEECKARMQIKSNPEARLDSEALKDYYRMATLPTGSNVKSYYLVDDLWVPICSINNNIFIFPGIPQLFQKLLDSFVDVIKDIYNIKDQSHEYMRYFVKTTLSESQISQYLRNLQTEASCVSDEIKIGSYPHFGLGFNTVSIFGTKDNSEYLNKIKIRTIEKLNGEELSAEYEEQISNRI